ncbi:hypothetical protein D3C73_1554810 [compost metagenome]
MLRLHDVRESDFILHMGDADTVAKLADRFLDRHSRLHGRVERADIDAGVHIGTVDQLEQLQHIVDVVD